MKIFLSLIILLAIAASAVAQEDSADFSMPEPPPFHVEYDSAVAYNLGLRESPRSILNKDGSLHKSTLLPGNHVDEKEIATLLKILNDNATFGGDPYACFEPKHAVLFYKHGKVSGSIQVCFGCNNLVSNPEFPAMNYHYRKVKGAYQNYGFSKKGVKKLKKYFKDVGLKVS